MHPAPIAALHTAAYEIEKQRGYLDGGVHAGVAGEGTQHGILFGVALGYGAIGGPGVEGGCAVFGDAEDHPGVTWAFSVNVAGMKIGVWRLNARGDMHFGEQRG